MVQPGLRGRRAGTNSFFGTSAGYQNISGANNTFVGYSSGTSNTVESNNTFIGAGAYGAGGISNATPLGYQATVSLSNSVVLGNGGVNLGIGVSAPKMKLHIAGGKLYLEANGQGVRCTPKQLQPV